MTKKILAILLTLMLILTFNVAAIDSDSRFDLLKELDIMVGYADGSLGLDNLVTRAEFVKMAVAASKYRDSVSSGLSVSPFSDVMYSSWYAPYVYLGASNKLLLGYKDGCFRPDNAVTYEEALTVALRLLGYEDSEFEYSWPAGQISVARNIGLSDGMNSYAGQNLNRNQVSMLFYNLLRADIKGGSTEYITTLNYSWLHDVVLTSSHNESSSVKKGYVYTSAGLYEVTDSFDYSLVGTKGDALLRDGKIAEFVPESTNTVKYNVFSVTGNSLVLFKDGAISDYKLDNSETLYFENQKTTVGEMLSKFSAGDVLELHCDKNWDLDYATYHESELEGPIVVSDSSWYQNTGIQSGATVVRDGVISSLSAIAPYDVVYYNTEMQNVWVCSKKVTGNYEAAVPNKDQIKQIKLSGVLYNVNSVEAYKALSSSGSVKIGDRVTLILDRDGDAVGALSSAVAGTESYAVYQVIGNSIVVYKDGYLKNLTLKNSDTAYLNGAATTVGNIKSALQTGYTIDVSRNADGTIDYVTVIESQLDGPYTVKNSSWMSEYGINSSAAVLRKGAKAQASDVKTNDIVYYSSTLNTVWAYCDTVTGVYESAEPNKDTPKTVTVSGKTYSIEGIDAYNTLSSNGSASFGDTITLLLGKNGEIADVANGAAVSDEPITGVLLSAGVKSYTDSSGKDYSSSYVVICRTDGTKAEYMSDKDYSDSSSVGGAVKIEFSDGKAKISAIPQESSVSGTFSKADMKLGSDKCADGIEILDVSAADFSPALCCKVYPQRLDGAYVSSRNVICAEKNAEGAISKLILKDVTGDNYSYGIVTSAQKNSMGMSISGSYTYFSGSTKQSAQTNGSSFSVYAGQPVKIDTRNGVLKNMFALNSAGTVSSIGSGNVVINGKTCLLWDKALCYQNTVNYEYQAITFEDLKKLMTTHTVTAYEDSSQSSGGRIRVLVAKKK